MLSELPDTTWPGDGAGGCERSAGDCAGGVHAHREHVRAVHVVAQQLVAAHVALRGDPSSVAKPVRASESGSRSVTETDSRRPRP